MEYALLKNVSLGLEYTRYDFGDENQTAISNSSTPYGFKHELDVDTLSVGLNYFL
jgi:opacity protein-like surface antigen